MTKTSWRIYMPEREEVDNAYVSSADGDTKDLLAEVVAMWTRDKNLEEWDDSDTMAAICYYHSTLGEREIISIFGTSGEGNYPGEPDWELAHPTKDEVMVVEKEYG